MSSGDLQRQEQGEPLGIAAVPDSTEFMSCCEEVTSIGLRLINYISLYLKV
jgi:hypothetical protein